MWHWSSKPLIAIKLLSESGHYPDFAIREPRHLYLPGSELTWTAVLQPSLPDDWEVAEFTPLSPEQVALFSAVALCESDPWNNGIPLLTHATDAVADPREVGSDLSDPTTIVRLRQIAESAAVNRWRRRPSGSSERFHIRRFGSAEDAHDLLTNIDTSDELLLAGLARYLGACRLIATTNELEEASLSLFISMGAGLEFIRQSLATDNEDVPFKRVSEHLAEAFPQGIEVAEYFEEMYDTRVVAIHPSSRFGDYWTVPLMVDDVFWLRQSLIGLYRYILLGDFTFGSD